MRKRFVTTLLTFLLTVACVFGFAACGEEEAGLTGEELKKAIQATLNSKKAEMNFIITQESANVEVFDKTEIFDDEKGLIVIKSKSENEAYYVTIDSEVWFCDLQDDEWSVRKYGSSFNEVREEFKGDLLMYCCHFKDKTNKSAEYTSFENTYSSFSYDSESGLYSASFMCIDDYVSEQVEEFEANVTLTVNDGYVTMFMFEMKPNDGEDTYVYNYTYTNIGTIEITVPDGALAEIEAKK